MSKGDGGVADGAIQDCGDNSIQVFVRVRPPEKEDASYHSILQVDSSSTSLVLESKPNPRQFSFDHVADTDATQESIFNHLGRKIIENCVAGYNGTIFAYGQTGSGKTYTMLGASEDSDNLYHEQRGVIPRSFEYLYSLISRQKDLHGDNIQFLCKCSFLEIYNEQIFDLIEPSAMQLHLRESLKTGVYVAGLAERVVADANEAYEALNSSLLNRRVASTSMNRESSRSHAIFTLQIESKERKGAVEHIRTSQLNLVDLAGSERQKDTNATGQRLKEAGSINKSLANLGNVIMCLVTVSSTGKKRYIPYRDSKLTFLLRDSLGGNSKTTLIACVHPGHKCFGETLSTLQFAKRAKMIKNKAVLNEDAHGDIKTLQAENRALREELRLLKAGTIPREPAVDFSGGSSEGLKEMFLQAMELQYKAVNEKMELEKDLDKLKAAYQKRENCLKSTKMIVKFRESTIAKLEGKVKEEKDEQVEKLKEEISSLREQLGHQQDGYSLINENSQLKMEVHRLTTASCLANIQAHEKKVCMLEAKYNELKREQDKESDEPKGTPQRSDAVSAATLEKLRSQVASLESENNELKKNLTDTKDAVSKKEMLLTSELDSFRMKSEELERMLKTSTELNMLEKEKMNEMHLQTVKTITTPRKERYRLRNRTVISAEPMTPDLDQSIPFELPETIDESNPFAEAQDSLLQDANEALLEQIKQLQDKNSELETRLSEYDSDRMKQLQQQSMLESQIKQMEEMLEKNKTETAGERAEYEALQVKLKKVTIDHESAIGEIRDLKLILDSTDKQLKEYKKKVKTMDTIAMGLESKISEFNMTLDQISKENYVLTEENEVLKVDIENVTETAKFYESQTGELEEKINCKDRLIKDLEQQLKTSETTLRDEQEKFKSYVEQNTAQDNEKENVILSKMEEIKSLQSKIGMLKNEHEALDATTMMLRNELETKDTMVLSLEKKLTNADEKINLQISQIEELNMKYQDLEQANSSSQEEILFLQSDNANCTKRMEELKVSLQQQEEEKRKYEAVNDGLTEDNDKLMEELLTAQEKLAASEEKINLHITQTEETNLKCQELEQRYISSEEQIQVLKSENANYSKKREELEALLADIVDEKHKQEAVIDGLTDDNSKLMEDLSLAREKLAAIEDHSKKLIDEPEKRELDKRSHPQDDQILCYGCQIKRSRMDHTKQFFNDIYTQNSPVETPKGIKPDISIVTPVTGLSFPNDSHTDSNTLVPATSPASNRDAAGAIPETVSFMPTGCQRGNSAITSEMGSPASNNSLGNSVVTSETGLSDSNNSLGNSSGVVSDLVTLASNSMEGECTESTAEIVSLALKSNHGDSKGVTSGMPLDSNGGEGDGTATIPVTISVLDDSAVQMSETTEIPKPLNPISPNIYIIQDNRVGCDFTTHRDYSTSPNKYVSPVKSETLDNIENQVNDL